MDLSSIKLVVADMDGTLLNSRHEVSPLFFELYGQLREKGVRFAAASGRQYNSIVDKLAPISQEITVIAENGGLAVHQGKELVFTPLDAAAQREILLLIKDSKDIHPVLCGKHMAYLTGESPAFIDTLKEYYTEYEILEQLLDFEGVVMKIALYHYGGSEANIYPVVRHLEPGLKVKVSGENWVDLSNPKAHKGYALGIIQEEFGITASETLVFGDYNNDLEMLAMADYSFAMANAHPNIVKAANYQTKSNDEYGVELVLQQLLKAKS